jgi:Cysteine-rich CWC
MTHHRTTTRRADLGYTDLVVMSWNISWGSRGPTVQRRTTCESCGEAFACELSASGCWCGKVELTDAARAEIRAQYKSCLCPTCLSRYERQRAGA